LLDWTTMTGGTFPISPPQTQRSSLASLTQTPVCCRLRIGGVGRSARAPHVLADPLDVLGGQRGDVVGELRRDLRQPINVGAESAEVLEKSRVYREDHPLGSTSLGWGRRCRANLKGLK
jgi:hypothetical protein